MLLGASLQQYVVDRQLANFAVTELRINYLCLVKLSPVTVEKTPCRGSCWECVSLVPTSVRFGTKIVRLRAAIEIDQRLQEKR
jgi:hypothetical protein